MSSILSLTSRLAGLHLRNTLRESQRILLSSPCPACQLVSNVHSEKFKNKPKKPANSFVAWLQANRSNIENEQPGINTVEIMRVAGRKWRDLPQEEKQRYKVEAKSNLLKYSEEKKAFDKSLSVEDKQEYLDMLKEKKRKRAKIRRNRLLRQLGKPKRAPSGFAFFVKAEMNHRPSGTSVVDYMGTLGKRWSSMSEDEKKPYVQEFLEDRERYEDEIKIWETQMAQDGYTNLLRPSQKKSKKKMKND